MTESLTYFCSVMHWSMTVMPWVLTSLPLSWPAYAGTEDRGASDAWNFCTVSKNSSASAALQGCSCNQSLLLNCCLRKGMSSLGELALLGALY